MKSSPSCIASYFPFHLVRSIRCAAAFPVARFWTNTCLRFMLFIGLIPSLSSISNFLTTCNAANMLSVTGFCTLDCFHHLHPMSFVLVSGYDICSCTNRLIQSDNEQSYISHLPMLEDWVLVLSDVTSSVQIDNLLRISISISPTFHAFSLTCRQRF